MFAFTLNHTISSRTLGLRLAAPVEIPAARIQPALKLLQVFVWLIILH